MAQGSKPVLAVVTHRPIFAIVTNQPAHFGKLAFAQGMITVAQLLENMERMLPFAMQRLRITRFIPEIGIWPVQITCGMAGNLVEMMSPRPAAHVVAPGIGCQAELKTRIAALRSVQEQEVVQVANGTNLF